MTELAAYTAEIRTPADVDPRLCAGSIFGSQAIRSRGADLDYPPYFGVQASICVSFSCLRVSYIPVIRPGIPPDR